MGKKKLVFMYIADSYGFYEQGLNFSTKENFYVNRESDETLTLIKGEDREGLPARFWGNTISEVKLLVGGNGSGKTTVMRIICQWICQISQNKFPQEEGILVLEDERGQRFLAFEKGRKKVINTTIPEFPMQEESIDMFFNDIRMVYFSNTMSELFLEPCSILMDYSKPNRIIEANADRYAIGDEIMANYHHHEFNEQISTALEDVSFPIHYILLKIRKNPDEIIQRLIMKSNRVDSCMIKDLKEFLESAYGDCSKNDVSNGNLSEMELINVIFWDFIKKMIDWGTKHKSDKEENKIKSALSDIVSNLTLGDSKNFQSGTRWMKEIIKGLIERCGNSNYNRYWSEFAGAWNNIGESFDRLLDFFETDHGREPNKKFVGMWKPYFAAADGKKKEYQIDFKQNKKIFQQFWEVYRPVSFWVESIYFQWNASSGEQNWIGMIPALQNSYANVRNIWYFLDEPDNTFHPEWERKLVRHICNTLNKSSAEKQVWISTHSPIMLSDMPGPAVGYLREWNGRKEVLENQSATFGQNIYKLYDDAFFLQDGVIGEFASEKITDIAVGLEMVERELLGYLKNGQGITEEKRKELYGRIQGYESLVQLVAEPLFYRQMTGWLNNCKRLMEK